MNRMEHAEKLLSTSHAGKVFFCNSGAESNEAAIKIARRTRHIVWENIVGAIGLKVVILVLGAMGVASLWAAVFADVGVALLAILNAMRLLCDKKY